MKNVRTKTLIISWIFWVTASASVAAPIAEGPTTAPVKSQGTNWKLVGTAVVNAHGGSLAVVEVDGKGQLFFREGDRFGDVVIKQIMRDRIIVDADAGEKIVKLRHSLSNAPQTQPDSTRPSESMQAFGPRPPESRSLQVVRLDQAAKESLLGEVDQSLKEVFIDQVTVYGRPTGVRISPIEPGRIFSKIGLRPGEVIREINGKAVTEPQEAVALFEQIQQGGEFDIKVKGRRTRRIHMVVD